MIIRKHQLLKRVVGICSCVGYDKMKLIAGNKVVAECRQG